MTVYSISVALGLVLFALLATGACIEEIIFTTTVTSRKCHSQGARVRWYPIDPEATGLTLDSCYITDTDHIKDDEFRGLPNLGTIRINFNHIVRVNASKFSYIPTVTSISLYYNKIRELTAFSRRSCPSLTDLGLSYNRLTNITFEISACYRLKTLSLSHNLIEYIHPDAFSSLTWLEDVYLENNNIRYIPKQLFRNNKRLCNLRLSNNKLTHLPDKLVPNVVALSVEYKYLSYSGNPWHCACLLELLMDIQKEIRNREYWVHFDGKKPECVFIGPQPCRRLPPSALRRNIARPSLA